MPSVGEIRKGERLVSSVFRWISVMFVPFMCGGILCYGLWKRAPIYEYFTEGVKEGLKAAAGMLPFLMAIFLGLETLTASGAMEFLENLAKPLLNAIGIPQQLTPLILLRPVSGSGSLAVLEETLKTVGPDSFVGRAACILSGSCETVFYVIGIYFSVTSVKRIRHCLPIGLICYAIGVLGAVWICRFM